MLSAKTCLLLGPAICAIALSLPAHAQSAPASPDEIVVTATRRAEPLSKVPQSVTALSQAALDQRGIRDISGIVRQTPGIQLDPNGFGNQTNIAIRGVSSTVGAATTGIYIDDTPIQSRQIGYTSTNSFPAVFDLDRVEVLRGPQGTLFGAGSEGGTVRFITPQPSLDATHVYARVEGATTQGGAPSGEVGAAINTPLVKDVLGLSLSGSIRRDGGYIDRENLNPEASSGQAAMNTNWAVTKVARGALRWKAAEGLEITPSIFFQDSYRNDSDDYWESASNPSAGRYVSGALVRSPDHDKFYLPALAINAHFGGVQLVSNTSYYHRDQTSTIDYSTLMPSIYDGTTYVPGDPDYRSYTNNTNSQRTFTQEVRLQSDRPDSRLNWVVGVFYSRSVQRFTEALYDPDFAAMFGGVPPQYIFGEALVDGVYSLKGYGRGADEQIAGFGEATFALTPRLKLTAGVRGARTSFEGSSTFDGPFPGGLTVQNPAKVTEHPVTPKFAVNWQTTADLLVYASAAKGYRIGGTNAPVTAAACSADIAAAGFAAVPETYKSDSLWSYEAGAKGKLAGGRVTFAASAFHVDWSNIQQDVYLQHCGAQFIANLGSAKSNGFDLQGTLRATHNLSFDGTLSYTDAHLSSNISGGTLNLASAGDHLETHPWTLSLGAAYEAPVTDRVRLYGRADYQYKSPGKRTVTTDPTTFSYDPDAYATPAVHFVSLRAGLRQGAADLSLFVDNLTNSHPVLSRSIGVVGVGSYLDVTLRPRTFGITLIYRN